MTLNAKGQTCRVSLPCKLLAASVLETIGVIKERDEARREAETQGRQLAALREALEELETSPEWGGDTSADFTAFTKWVQGVAGKALTNTTEAAVQWKRVPWCHLIVPDQPTSEWIRRLKKRGFRGGNHSAMIMAVLAAAPAAKGEAGEGTRHLTVSEAQSMEKALRKSVEIVKPPKVGCYSEDMIGGPEAGEGTEPEDG